MMRNYVRQIVERRLENERLRRAAGAREFGDCARADARSCKHKKAVKIIACILPTRLTHAVAPNINWRSCAPCCSRILVERFCVLNNAAFSWRASAVAYKPFYCLLVLKFSRSFPTIAAIIESEHVHVEAVGEQSIELTAMFCCSIERVAVQIEYDRAAAVTQHCAHFLDGQRLKRRGKIARRFV